MLSFPEVYCPVSWLFPGYHQSNPECLRKKWADQKGKENQIPLYLLLAEDEIRAVGKRKGLSVVSYAPSTVKKHICGNGRASKKELSKVIVSKYPELKVYLTQDRAWKEEYHQNMFDAVALGLMASSLRVVGSHVGKTYND